MGKVSINGEILKWAREKNNLSVNEVARHMNKKEEDILSWEAGTDFPTYVQLEKLATKILKRPIAVFFFPEPPEEDEVKTSFRTYPEFEYEKLPSHVFTLFRKAKSMQLNLYELCNKINPAKKQIIKDISLTGKQNININEVTKYIREYIGISLDTQKNWRDTDIALKEWRNAITECGIFVFKDAFNYNEMSGFCIYDKEFPIIFINNSMFKTRQIFTLFHELAHILFGTGGIDSVNDNYIGNLTGNDWYVETFCNNFAGKFLVPENDFTKTVNRYIDNINEDSISKMAKEYSVSREVILRKLLDRKIITEDYYREKSDSWTKEAIKQRSSRKEGGNYYANQLTYLGTHYLDIAFTEYYRNRVDIYQLSEYLGIKVDKLFNLEAIYNS